MRLSAFWTGVLPALWLVALFTQALLAADGDLATQVSHLDSSRSIQRLSHALASKFGVESNQVFFVPAAQAVETGEFLIRGYNISCKESGGDSAQAQVLCVDSRGDRVGGLSTAEYSSALKPVLR